jgi:hypothetical protein
MPYFFFFYFLRSGRITKRNKEDGSMELMLEGKLRARAVIGVTYFMYLEIYSPEGSARLFDKLKDFQDKRVEITVKEVDP